MTKKGVRKYSIKEFEDLVSSIIQATSLTEEAISERVGRNTGFLAQVRSRAKITGEVSEKPMKALQGEFKVELQNAMQLTKPLPLGGLSLTLKDVFQMLTNQNEWYGRNFEISLKNIERIQSAG